MKLLLAIPLALALACSAAADTGWPPIEKGWLEYVDPSGLWRAVSKGGELEPNDNWESRAWPFGYHAMSDEGGCWYVFQLGMRPGVRLVLSAESQVVLTDKRGRRMVGEMRYLRPPDSGSVTDIWEQPVVVSRGAFYTGSIGVGVAVRFAAPITAKKIARVTVEGVRVLHAEGR